MKDRCDDRRAALERLLALAGAGLLAGCAGGNVSYSVGVSAGYGPGWGSPWYGRYPYWGGPIYVGPPVVSRPGRPVTLPSY
ncbi:MAG: hypothetical protein J0L57_12125, partial [Burkholderiales bacterium]|nr:hypothetical protein [Burkholderiales bacterium]